jgi:hypothetical protein
VRITRFKAAAVILAVILIVGLVGARVFPQSRSSAEDRPRSEVFSEAHVSVGEAVDHFFGLRPEPTQPIAFHHKAHIDSDQLTCIDCHISVEKGPKAGIPDVRTCWSCHQNILTNHPEIQKVRAYRDRGEDIPWQRVYGWNHEAHVRFNHAPHIRAKVECSTCHGNVAEMTVATRAVDHTMGFCIDCHKERKVSNDCWTCHY